MHVSDTDVYVAYTSLYMADTRLASHSKIRRPPTKKQLQTDNNIKGLRYT